MDLSIPPLPNSKVCVCVSKLIDPQKCLIQDKKNGTFFSAANNGRWRMSVYALHSMLKLRPGKTESIQEWNMGQIEFEAKKMCICVDSIFLKKSTVFFSFV